MFCKVYNLEFASIGQAKSGVSFLSEKIGGVISESNIANLSILLDKKGIVSVTVRFDTLEAMAEFGSRKAPVFTQLKQKFAVRFNEMSAVAVFSFEREAGSIS